VLVSAKETCFRPSSILNCRHECEPIGRRQSLPLSERIELVDALWESIIQDGHEPELTTVQAEELDHRLAAHETKPDAVVSWETVNANLEAERGNTDPPSLRITHHDQ
jgi:putative addiction module component (TIGR02574 family)